MSWAGWRLGDAFRTTGGAWRSGPPGLVVGSGGLGGPAVWLDPMPVEQLPQALDLAVEPLVLLDDRGKVHLGRPCSLALRPPRPQLPLLIAQRRGPLEVLRIDRGLLVPPHLRELLLSLAKIIRHGHAHQPRPCTCLLGDLLATGVAGQQLDDLLADPRQVGTQLDQHLGGHPLALPEQPEQQVLGADVIVIEEPSLLLGEHHHPPRPGGP
jgi:hypothetical protein